MILVEENYKYQVKEYLENLYDNMNILFNDNLPTDTAFQKESKLDTQQNFISTFQLSIKEKNWMN